MGPDSSHRAENIASNPYAATQFFNFIVHAMLETLMGVTKHGSQLTSIKGILGEIAGYFGVVEAQGQGMLHLHMLMWLAGTPDSGEMETALKRFEFQEKVCQYIRTNIRAHLDDVTDKDICPAILN